jgi:hydroxymethylbilane synthase
MKLRIGSRGSKLAVTQAEWVASQLKKIHPTLDISFLQIVTTGDRESGVNPSLTKAVFVKEIEEALLRGDIDLAIHSLKDMPQQIPAGLVLGPTPFREDPRDALISRFGEYLHELPRHSTIGTSSLRRQAQINFQHKRRDYRLEPMRGNVDTRLRKLQEGKVDAIVLAYAGLKRLGLDKEVTQVLEFEEMLPAACQGCLGLEVKEKDMATRELLEGIKDAPSDIAARAERAFLQGLGGDCNIPLGVASTLVEGELRIRALLFDAAGENRVEAEQAGPKDQPEYLGAQLAERLLYNGGSELMMEPKAKSS